MPWDAIDALDDARAATEALILPVSWRAWLRLAVVTFFVGGVGGGGGVGQAVQGVLSAPPPRTPAGVDGLDGLSALPSVPSGLDVGLVAVAALVAVAVAVVAYGFVGAVMAFVLVDGLRSRRVHVRRPFRQFLGPGARLFGFRALVLTVLAAGVALPVVAAVAPRSVAGPLALPLVAVAFVAVLLGTLALRLTTDLAVPTMVAEGRTVLSAWRRLLPLLRSEWREVGLFLVARVALGVAASVVVGLVVGLAALVVAIPFLLVGSTVAVAVGLDGLGLAVVVGLVVVFVAVLAAVSVVVQVPVVVYLRYYGLFLLGRLDGRLDLVGGPDAPGSRTVDRGGGSYTGPGRE